MAYLVWFLYGILDDFSGMIPLLLDEARVRATQRQSDRLTAAKQQISTAQHVGIIGKDTKLSSSPVMVCMVKKY